MIEIFMSKTLGLTLPHQSCVGMYVYFLFRTYKLCELLKIFTGETVEIERGLVVRRTLHSFHVVDWRFAGPCAGQLFLEL